MPRPYNLRLDFLSPLEPTFCIITLPHFGHTHLRFLWNERFSSFIPILQRGQSITQSGNAPISSKVPTEIQITSLMPRLASPQSTFPEPSS